MGQKRFARYTGFTIVELLIVIVVIGVLAAIVLNSFSNAQDKAKKAKVENDIAVLEKAIVVARENDGKTLFGVTGHTCTGCLCPYTGGYYPVYSTLPKSHDCWTRYYTSLDRIGAAAMTNLEQLKAGDPWGNPYIIDENEGEAGGCSADSLRSVGKSGNINGGTTVLHIYIPVFSSSCI